MKRTNRFTKNLIIILRKVLSSAIVSNDIKSEIKID
jgi:hypothetical protein